MFMYVERHSFARIMTMTMSYFDSRFMKVLFPTFVWAVGRSFETVVKIKVSLDTPLNGKIENEKKKERFNRPIDLLN